MANDTLAARPKEHRENRKKNRGRKVEEDQAMAVAKFIRVPPRKARLVMDSVRGRYASEALAFLRFIPNRAAGYISKVLASACANAVNNHGLTYENLRLVEARVDEGPRMKRVQPRAQGRAYRILKRMSHITVIVQEVEPKPVKPRKPTGARAQAARAIRQAAPQMTAQIVEPSAAETQPNDMTFVVGENTVPAAEDTTATEATAAETTAQTASAETNAAPETTTADTAPTESTPVATNEVTQGEQVADTADKTDEIGAPIEPETPQA